MDPRAHSVKKGWMTDAGAYDDGAAGSVETVELDSGRGLSHPDIELVVEDYVDADSQSAIRSVFEGASTGDKWNVQPLVPTV